MLVQKRFLIFTQYFPPEIGATQSRLAALARELTRSGHRVEVVTAMPHHLGGRIFPEYRGKLFLRDVWEGITVYRTWLFTSRGSSAPLRLVNYGSFAMTSGVGLFAAMRPDYLIVESPPPFLAIPAHVRKILTRVPTILNVADLWPESVSMLGVMHNKFLLGLGRSLALWAYRHSKYINAVTEGIRQGLVDLGVAESKVLFFPNGVDTRTFYPRPPDSALIARFGLAGKSVFIFPGTHGLATRLDLLLEVARRLQSTEVVFMLVGDGPTKKALVQRAQDQNISNVLFVDPVSEGEMPAYFSLARACIVPLAQNKLFEGSRPAKIFPALASGVPIVYSGEGEGARLIDDAQAGLVVRPESLDEMTGAVLQMSRDAPLHDRLAENGRRYVLDKYDWSSIVGDWLAQLEERESRTS